MKGFLSLKKIKTKKTKKSSSFFRYLSLKPFVIALLIINFVLSVLLIYLFLLIFSNFTSSIKVNKLKAAAFPYYLKIGSELNVSSKALIVYEPEGRVTVMGKNENFRFSPASTAKIMSAVVVLEQYSLNQILVASDLKNVEGSKMGLFEGEEISVENLLYGMMLPSGNDAAYVLAKNYPGGIKGFVEKMNQKVKDLKLKNTEFFDPAGYSDENYTTAIDLARITAYAMQNPEFRKIVSTRETKVFDVKGLIPHNLNNLNRLLSEQNVNGVKTGFTEEAGGVLVTSVNNKGKNYIVVVLKSLDRFYDTDELIQKVVKSINLISY